MLTEAVTTFCALFRRYLRPSATAGSPSGRDKRRCSVITRARDCLQFTRTDRPRLQRHRPEHNRQFFPPKCEWRSSTVHSDGNRPVGPMAETLQERQSNELEALRVSPPPGRSRSARPVVVFGPKNDSGGERTAFPFGRSANGRDAARCSGTHAARLPERFVPGCAVYRVW